MDNCPAFSTDKYDNEIRRTLPYYEEIYRQVVDVVRIHNPKQPVWLDIGCGTGKMAETAAGKLEIKRFVCSDSSEEMIKRAELKCSGMKAEFVVSRAQNLCFKNEFDVVTAIQVYHYFNKEERTAAVKNCYEALKDNGIFISFENFAPESEAGEKLYLERWRAFQLEQGKSRKECDRHIQRYGKDYFPITVAKNLEGLRAVGFQTAEILWLSYMQVGVIGIK